LKVVYIEIELLHVKTYTKIYIQHLSKQDVVVVWGGSKDKGEKNKKQKRVVTLYRNLLRQSYKFYT